MSRRSFQHCTRMLAVALGCASLNSPAPLWAQTLGTRQQAAEALFQQGRELLDAGNYAAACQRFEASQKLDAGIGTLLFLGECYDQEGRAASAWKAFDGAAQLAVQKGDAERARLAKIRASALEPTVPELRVRVAPGTRALAAVDYTLNGGELAASDLDRPVPVDPGRVLLRVTAPGREPWEATLEILVGPSTAVVDVPELAPLRGQLARIEGRGSLSTPAPAPPDLWARPAPAESPGSGLRTASVILGVVGLGGVGVGTYFAVHAVSEAKQSKEVGHCPLPDRCYPSGIALRDDARRDAHLADLAIGMGASLLVGGVVLYLLAPSAQSSEAHALGRTRLSLASGRGAAALSLENSW